MDKKKCAARVLSFVTALVVLAVLAPAAALADAYDHDQQTGITIQLQDIGSPMGNVPFRCYQVGQLSDGANVEWEPVPALKDVGVDLNALDTARDLQQAAQLLAQKAPEAGVAAREATTDTAGKARFTGLEQGVYLLVQADTAQYGTCAPFLIAVPYSEDGSWVYHAEAAVKGESLPPPTQQPPPSPQTGDQSNPVLWAVLAVVAIVGLAAMLVYRRVRSNR